MRRILAVAQPDRSYCSALPPTGQMTTDSDSDLLVVEPTPANTHERSVQIREALGNIGYPADLIVMPTDRFERTKRVIGGIAYPANKYGRVIYAAAGTRDRVVAFQWIEKADADFEGCATACRGC